MIKGRLRSHEKSNRGRRKIIRDWSRRQREEYTETEGTRSKAEGGNREKSNRGRRKMIRDRRIQQRKSKLSKISHLGNRKQFVFIDGSLHPYSTCKYNYCTVHCLYLRY
jgi:hypothetical protein